MEKFKRLKYLLVIITLLMILLNLIFSLLFKNNIYLSFFPILYLMVFLPLIFYNLESVLKEKTQNIENNIESNIKQAIDYAQVGILVYNNDFEITFQSTFFKQRNLIRLNEKLFSWLPEIQSLINNEVDKIEIVINEYKFDVIKKDNAQVLFFKDVSLRYDLKKSYEDEKLVLGFLNYDNFDEIYDFGEDQSLAFNYLQQTVYEYLKKYKIVFKQIRNNRLLLIMNEFSYNQLLNDRFSILNIIRKKAQDEDLLITLSLAIARGSNDLIELDELANNLLELAQNRGGDQVVIRKIGEDIKYFGGSSEAREKQSKVKVRVVAHTLKDLISKASNVIIIGHIEADADCVGASIVMSKIASRFNDNVYILNKSGGIEAISANVLKKYDNELSKEHIFISQNEALNHLNDNTLVIMVDHHLKDISAGKEVLNIAKKVVIIDHHRRNYDLDLNTILVYIESSASSSVELISEFIPYTLKRSELNPIEANMAYLGILIDTNRFRKRTGSRTYDVMSMLRKFGADPIVCDELNQEPFNHLIMKSKIINNAKEVFEGILVAIYEDERYVSRAIMSQASDEMIQSRDIFAAFVIALINDDEVAISARSNGNFNVQMVMEKMNGGGHMYAAGLQRKDVSIKEIYDELIEVIKEYLKENYNESNNVE